MHDDWKLLLSAGLLAITLFIVGIGAMQAADHRNAAFTDPFAYAQ